MKKYEKYKNSGVEWINEIPENWKVESFKNILVERNEKNNPIKSKEILSLSIDKGVTLYSEKTTNLDRFKDDFTQYKLAYKGDLVFNSMNMIVGAVGVSNYFGCVSPVYYTYFGSLNNPNSTKFYEYLFRSKTVQRVLYSLGKGLIAIDRGDGKYNTLRLKVSRDDLRSMKLPNPDLSEQKEIVKFLDEKTTKIDQAIAIKQKQIELLKERRQILIHKAVTRGLDDTVKLKDSGVEWIGEIPEHWEVKRLKDICSINLNSLPENTNKDYEFEYVDIGSVSLESGINNIEEYTFKSAPSRARRIAKKGDTVISTVRTYLKAIDFIDEVKSKYIYSTGFAVLQPKEVIFPEFLGNFVRSDAFTEQVTVNSKGMSYPAINSTDIGRLTIVHCGLEEQKQIVEYIETATTKIATAISFKEQEIEKLKEYKMSLIDGVVTGKVRVC